MRFRVAPAALLLLTSISAAADRAGRYSATELIARWNVGDWGEACGPRPSGGSEPPATFQVESSGNELTFVGPRTYRTTGCWEQMPGLRATSHSATASAIRTVCTMPPGDPREATITTNWTLRADKLYLDEVGQYRFLLGGQACTASVRRTRVWTKLADSPLPAPSTMSSTIARSTQPDGPRNALPPAPSAPSDVCVTPGPVARLVTRGPTKMVIAGQTIPLDVAPLDAHGCVLDTQVRYEVRSGAPLVANLGRGVLTVAESAPRGKIVIEARVERLSLELVVKVVSREEYSALLEGESTLPAVSAAEGAPDRRTNVTVESAPVEPSASTPLLSKVGAVALGVGTLVSASYFLLRRRKRPELAESKAPSETPTKICPICGRRYENQATFCGDDGARLLRAN